MLEHHPLDSGCAQPAQALGKAGTEVGRGTLGSRGHGHFRCTILPMAETKIQKPVLEENVTWRYFLLSMPIHCFLKIQMFFIKNDSEIQVK